MLALISQMNFSHVSSFIYNAGLETHGGPGAIGPRIFQMAPRFSRSGAKRAL